MKINKESHPSLKIRNQLAE